MTTQKELSWADMLARNPILIISGEGERGTAEPYNGARTERAIRVRLTRERAHGDRWARAVVYMHECGDGTHAGCNIETGECCSWTGPAPESDITRAAGMLGARGGASTSPAKAAASRRNGVKGGKLRHWVHGKVEVGRELGYRRAADGGKVTSLGRVLEIRPSATYKYGVRVAVCERGERGYGAHHGRVWTRPADGTAQAKGGEQTMPAN